MTHPEDRAAQEPVQSPDGARVSTVIGDRLCIECGFNLTGQPVMKESTYNLFIARCPECGAVASMQEYPVLGKWANRWASLAAALWLGVIFAGVFGLGAAFFATSVASTQAAADSVSRAIILEWTDTPSGQKALASIRERRNDPNAIINRWNPIDMAWWSSQNGWDVLQKHGGWRQIVLSPAISIWSATMVIGGVGGVVLSVAMLHIRRRRLTLYMLLPIAVAAVFQILFITQAMLPTFGMTVRNIAFQLIAPATMTTTDVFAYIGLIVGVMIGRSVARWLVAAMLPPRMRSSLSFLWISAGKMPPKTTP